MPGVKNRVQLSYEESHRVNNDIIEKKCNKCGNWFSLNEDNFYKNKCSPDGYFPKCKECEKTRSLEYKYSHHDQQKASQKRWREEKHDIFIQQMKDWRKDNKEYKQQYQLEYQRNNTDKLKIYGKNRKHKNHNITKRQWEICKAYFNYECAYCGITEKEAKKRYKQKLHKEHFDDNGANDLSNCVPACKSCNSSKWEHDANEWYNKQSFYSEERLEKIIKWITEDYKLIT